MDLLRSPTLPGRQPSSASIFTGASLCVCSVAAVQSLSCVCLFATLGTAACQASPYFINCRSLLKLTPIESVMPSNHLILCHPLLLLPSIFPSIRVFFSSELTHCNQVELPLQHRSVFSSPLKRTTIILD